MYSETQSIQTQKTAQTSSPIHSLIANRWSARSFEPKNISEESLTALLEAGRWSASANNEQPWHFIAIPRDSSRFLDAHACLMPGNQPWAKNAAAFIICLARKTFAANEKPNAYAWHDVGMATANILLEATAQGLYSHPMGGFDREKIRNAFEISDAFDVLTVIALGYPNKAEKLEEPFLSRELSTRQRKNLADIAQIVL